MIDREKLAEALAAHQPSTGAGCRCGWTGNRLVAFESGRSIPEQYRAHVADVLSPSRESEVMEEVASDRERTINHLQDILRGKKHVVDVTDLEDAIDKIKADK